MIPVKGFGQRSPEWDEARRGKPTASAFKRILDTSGNVSKSCEKYMFDLAMERITGKIKPTYKSKAMDDGIEREDDSLRLYEFMTGNTVETVDFCYRDERKLYLCSPDGIMDYLLGGLELKNPEAATHWKYIQTPEHLVKDYFQQVQGCLFVTGYDWWDIQSHYEEMSPVIMHVEPDLDWHKKLEDQLEIMCEEIPKIVDRIKNAKVDYYFRKEEADNEAPALDLIKCPEGQITVNKADCETAGCRETCELFNSKE